MNVRLWQYSGATGIQSPYDSAGLGTLPVPVEGSSGNRTKHSPPLRELSRSNNGGPKNQATNEAHTSVVAIHLVTLLVGREIDGGDVKKIPKNARDDQPHAFFTKYWLKMLCFWAKYED